MARRIRRPALFFCGLVFPVILILASAGLMAQNDEAKPQKKPRGRLPNYYTKVVTPEQRKEIYSIQQGYASQIEELEVSLANLRAKRDKEVAAVLSAEQLEKVEKLREEAAERRKKKGGAAKKTAATKPAA